MENGKRIHHPCVLPRSRGEVHQVALSGDSACPTLPTRGLVARLVLGWFNFRVASSGRNSFPQLVFRASSLQKIGPSPIPRRHGDSTLLPRHAREAWLPALLGLTRSAAFPQYVYLRCRSYFLWVLKLQDPVSQIHDDCERCKKVSNRL
jgi:hypothetical protein